MEGKEKTYIVYRATAPNGKCYVGYTSMTLTERWRHHKRRAENGEAPEHPFYCAIRNYGAEKFQVEEICRTNNRLDAMRLEEKHIAETPEELSMNLSSGGINDGAEGGRIFWERMNANPAEKAAFLKKLSDRKRRQDWTDYDKLRLGNERWRREHPREAYALAYRAIRIANRVTGRPAPCESPIDPRPLKERLMHKYRQHDIRSAAVAQVWEGRSESEKADISSKIAAAQKKHFSTLSEAEKRQVTEKARAAIDRKKQGAAASRGIKAWWAELKKNPEAYRAYMEARTKTLLDNRRKRNADI